MLMFHDLIKLIFPNARRVGKLMVGEIVGYFGALVGSVLPAAKELRLELNTWCRWIIGKKLNLLCTEFGPRCLFFLVPRWRWLDECGFVSLALYEFNEVLGGY